MSIAAIIQILNGLVSAVLAFLRLREGEKQQNAGRDAQIVEQTKANVEAAQEDRQVDADAKRKHAADKSDTAFDPDFWRD